MSFNLKYMDKDIFQNKYKKAILILDNFDLVNGVVIPFSDNVVWVHILYDNIPIFTHSVKFTYIRKTKKLLLHRVDNFNPPYKIRIEYYIDIIAKRKFKIEKLLNG